MPQCATATEQSMVSELARPDISHYSYKLAYCLVCCCGCFDPTGLTLTGASDILFRRRVGFMHSGGTFASTRSLVPITAAAEPLQPATPDAMNSRRPNPARTRLLFQLPSEVKLILPASSPCTMTKLRSVCRRLRSVLASET